MTNKKMTVNNNNNTELNKVSNQLLLKKLKLNLKKNQKYASTKKEKKVESLFLYE